MDAINVGAGLLAKAADRPTRISDRPRLRTHHPSRFELRSIRYL